MSRKMSGLLKRPYTPDELAEILRGMIEDKQEERKRCYKSAERSAIDVDLKALRQLEGEQFIKIKRKPNNLF